jgi:outer membrane protein insertion porin family
VAYITGYGGKEVPPYSRFYMGGEDDIRGYDIRSISPVTFIPTETAIPISYPDPSAGGALRTVTIPALIYTATLPGGDMQAFGNVEYRIPIVKTYVQAAFFFDGGTDGISNRDGLKLDPTGVAKLQQDFPGAGVDGSLPVAAHTNFRLRGSAGIEFVVQLPIVQAPFRIYYAYNVHRLHEQLVAQQPFFNEADKNFLENQLNQIDPTIWPFIVKPQPDNVVNNPGRLNYFEPATTFRFTVSRTF